MYRRYKTCIVPTLTAMILAAPLTALAADVGLDTQSRSDLGTGTAVGSETEVGASARIRDSRDSGVGSGTGIPSSTGAGAGIDSGASFGGGIDSGTSFGAGASASSGF